MDGTIGVFVEPNQGVFIKSWKFQEVQPIDMPTESVRPVLSSPDIEAVNFAHIAGEATLGQCQEEGAKHFGW